MGEEVTFQRRQVGLPRLDLISNKESVIAAATTQREWDPRPGGADVAITSSPW